MIKKLLTAVAITSMATSMTIAGVWAGSTKTVTDHAGNTVEIPTNPKRIASLHTMSTTAMLWDLDAKLIGTATRLKKDENNRPYIRSVEEIYNIKFQDTGLANYGKFGSDIEQIKASKPDLIVGTVRHAKVYDKLSAIAPTVLIDYMSHDLFSVYGDLASWVGKVDVFNEKNKKFQSRIQQVKKKYSMPTEKQTVAYAHPYPGKAQYLARIQYGAFLHTAYTLGFKPLPYLEKQYGRDGIGGKLTAETFGQFNPDWLLSTYRNQTGETIETVYKGFDEIAPGWRSYNNAYKNKQVIAINREMAYPMGFKSMNWVLDQFEKQAK